MTARPAKPIRFAPRAFAAIAAAVTLVAVAHGAPFRLQPLTGPRQAIPPGARIHPVNLLGDQTADLAIVQGSTVAIHTLDGKNYQLRQTVSLPAPTQLSGKSYYSFARLGNKDRYSLVFMTPEGVYHYPLGPDGLLAQPTILLKRPTALERTGEGSLQYFDFAIDLNNDGLDELLLPQDKGFAIFRQDTNLQFTEINLPRSAQRVSKTFFFQQLLSPDPPRVPAASGALVRRRGVENLLLYDANGDGLQDLIFSKVVPGPGSKELERYEIFLQGPRMAFNAEPSQTIEVPYEVNADVTFRDFDRDGRLDAVAIQSNMDVVNPRTVMKFFMATRDKNQMFTRETDRFVTRDPIGIVRLADFNRDGYTDFALTNLSYQFGSAEDIVDIVLASKVGFKLQFFLGGPKGFSHKPSAEKELQLSMKPDSYDGYPPLYIVDDMNGDGISDLVVRTDQETVQIFVSQAGLAFPGQPNETLTVPEDAQLTFRDLNGDRLTDLIVSSRKKETARVYLSGPGN